MRGELFTYSATAMPKGKQYDVTDMSIPTCYVITARLHVTLV